MPKMPFYRPDSIKNYELTGNFQIYPYVIVGLSLILISAVIIYILYEYNSKDTGKNQMNINHATIVALSSQEYEGKHK